MPGLHCTYDPEPKLPPRFEFVKTVVARAPSTHDPIANVEAPIAAHLSDERLLRLEERLEHLTQTVRLLQGSRTSGATSVSGLIAPEADGRQSASTSWTANTDIEAGGRGAGHLAIQAGGRTRYISSTHWGLIADDLDEVEALLRNQVRYDLPEQRDQQGKST